MMLQIAYLMNYQGKILRALDIPYLSLGDLNYKCCYNLRKEIDRRLREISKHKKYNKTRSLRMDFDLGEEMVELQNLHSPNGVGTIP